MSHTKLVNCFTKSLGIESDLVVDSLEYNSIPEWDSIAHMTLVASIEDSFGVMLDTDEIIDLSSVERSIIILRKHGVEF